MKKHFRSRYSIAGIIGVLSVSGLTLPSKAQASLMIEPMALVNAGSSNSSLMTGGASFASAGAGLRFGVEKDDYFSALEGRYEFGNPGGGGSGYTLTFGVVGGVNLTYVPIRLQLGFNFSDSYSDSYMSAGGGGFSAGIGYFITDHIVLNLGYIYHGYDQVSPKQTNLNVGGFNANAATISLSFPFNFETPTEPWRRKREIEAASRSQRTETPEAAPAPMPETPPAEVPPAAPPAEAPPAETPPATPSDQTQVAPQPETTPAAPQAETPSVPQPQGTESVPPPPPAQ